MLDCSREIKRREAAADLHDVGHVVHLRLHARHFVHLLQVVVSEDAKREKRQAMLKEGKRRCGTVGDRGGREGALQREI